MFYFFLILLIIFRIIFSRPNFIDGNKIHVTFKITQEPIKYSFKKKLDLYGLTVYLPLFPKIYYGDGVVVEGIVDLSGGKLSGSKLLNAEPTNLKKVRS